jgi:DNA-directed RNA polymerase II subunit RPB2
MSSITKNTQLEIATPSSEEIFKLIDLYFNERFILYNYQWSAFNQFINDTIRNEISNIEHIIHEDQHAGKIYRYKIIFENVAIKPPVDDNANDEEVLFPEDCRTRFLTYASKLIADVSQVQEIIDCESSGDPEANSESETGSKIVVIAKENRVPIAKIPIMVRSEYCSTNLKNDRPNTECRFDPGCYFIIKGSEKVVIGLERICTNKMLCFTKKDPNFVDGVMYTCQVNSQNMNYDNGDGSLHNIQIVSVRMKKDNSVILNMTQFADIPIFIIFRALGITTDNDIINYIISDPTDTDMLNILKISLNKALSENVKDEHGNAKEIKTQDDAYQYLMTKLKNKRYSSTNIETNSHQRRKHLEVILSRDFLPHMGTTADRVTHKAYYLGKMVHKLLNTFMGRADIDDRDSFINKRIDLPGPLMAQLFRQYFKKMLNDCGKYFKKKNNGNHTNPIDVIKFIKFTTIEQGLTSALLTGTWGSSKRKGVAQMLQRLTYKQFISYFRRIMPPPVDASNSKVTSMRHGNGGHYGFVDLVETPDGHKVGLHKHISLMCSITISMNYAHINAIKDILLEIKNPKTGKPFMASLTNVPLNLLSKKIHINVNGEWLGVCDNPFDFVTILKEKRRYGEINIQASINFNIKNKSIDIYTDGGRMIRPLLRVENNKLLLTKDMLSNIDPAYSNKNKVTKWGEFIQKYPEVIEYVDVEECENLMIAMYPSEIDESRQKMLKGENPSEGGRGNPANRYDKVYVKYTHCEFHPMMFMGVISSNIPFSEHNQAPRNYFNFAQTRQGMGIYASNHRYRVDLSYLLYHPMRPLVITRAAKYTNELDVPAGEMMMVAIACYTGYNQEDSIVMNRSSMQRGMGVSTTLKKYSNTITKNTATGQDDIFMKPDRNKVTGMMDLNYYNKLNDKGYVPEETVVTNGDIIIGKVSPIQAGSNTNQLYKDESEPYKSTVPGTVDKVYTGIYNSDGYEMYNIRIRSERNPMTGDKLCVTPDHEVLTENGWIRFDELYAKYTTDNEFRQQLKVAQLNNGNMEYVEPIDVFEFDYNDKMYKLESQMVDFQVTKDHMLYIKKRDKQTFESVKATKVYGKRVNFKKNCEYKGKICKTIKITENGKSKSYDINAYLKLIGMFVSDGFMDGSQATIKVNKERKMEYLNDSLKGHIEYKMYTMKNPKESVYENLYVFKFTDKIINAYLSNLSVGAINKFLPKIVFKLDQSHARVLLEALINGDGHINKNSGCECFYTSSLQLANDVQRLSIHAGYSGTIKTVRSIDTPDLDYKLNADCLVVRLNYSKNEPQINHGHVHQQNGQKESWVNYNGKVYCLQVPSGVFMIRYNNKNHWTCNCSRHGYFLA